MKIEAGKYYRTRDGRKAGPAALTGYSWQEEWPWSLGQAWTYQPDGVCGDGGHPSLDLVAEWQNDPVVTETVTVERKRIVPSQYGAVTVEDAGASGAAIGIDLRVWSVADLRAAAATITQIADALAEGATCAP